MEVPQDPPQDPHAEWPGGGGATASGRDPLPEVTQALHCAPEAPQAAKMAESSGRLGKGSGSGTGKGAVSADQVRSPRPRGGASTGPARGRAWRRRGSPGAERAVGR